MGDRRIVAKDISGTTVQSMTAELGLNDGRRAYKGDDFVHFPEYHYMLTTKRDIDCSWIYENDSFD